MKKKLSIFLMVILMIFLFCPSINASSAGTSLNNRMNDLLDDIDELKERYNDILVTYSDVVDELSSDNKNALITLEDNLLADNIGTTIDAIKTELQSLSNPDALEVLDAINDMEDDAKDIMDEAEDIVSDMSKDYSSLTSEEIEQIVDKATDAITSLGINTNVTDTYDEVMDILNDAHTKALSINDDIKEVLDNHLNAFKEGFTTDNLQSLLSEVRSKDIVGTLDELIRIANNTSSSSILVPKLQNIKTKALDLKSKILELNSIDEKDILLFSETQKNNISDKILLVERDYIAFAKVVINDNSEDYFQVAADLAYNISIDKMIDKANDALDTLDDYKDTIRKLKNGDFTGVNVPDSVKKLGLLVTLGYVDITRYNREYVENNFGNEIDYVIDYVTEDILDYIDHIESSMRDEITSEINKSIPKSTIQSNLVNMNLKKFDTIDDMKALKTRVDNELLSNRSDLRSKLNTAMPRIYDIFYDNVLFGVEKIMLIENELTNKRYYYNSLRNYILIDTFLEATEFNEYIGLPNRSELYNHTNLVDSKFKTSSLFNITLSENVYQSYTIAVLGDVYADGSIDSRDYMAIKNYILEKDPLSFIRLVAANAYTRDSLINSQDYMVIKNHIMGKDTISL